MGNYLFEEQTITKLYNIIFICGVKYNRYSAFDKRNVLKKYLDTLSNDNKVIILEENFVFGKSYDKYLSYDDIFMKNLKDIETLTAIFADKVIIVHESISTAAEFGMFAVNNLLKNKLCVLVPDEYSVEENKISAFLNLAFFRNSSNIKKIIFYPSVTQWKISKFKSDFRTNFYNNTIGENLSRQIQDFLLQDKEEEISIKFKRGRYGKFIRNKNTISYLFREDKNTVNINVSVQLIRIYVIAFFNLSEFRTEIRKSKKFSEHVSFVENLYKETLIHTISNIEGINFENAKINCGECNLEFRTVIAYALYLLQAMNMIEINKDKEKETYNENDNYRKIKIKDNFRDIYINYNSLVIVNEILLGEENI